MTNDCTVYNTVDFISKKWSILIILELSKGDSKWKRYSEIKRNLSNITSKVLVTRLKELESEKVIKKRTDNKFSPPKTEYSLTKSGIDFIPIIQNIKQWGLKWKNKGPFCETSDCKYCNYKSN